MPRARLWGDYALITSVNECLALQARRWRGILTGEKDPADMLSTTSYLNAATSLVSNYMHLGRTYLLRWWPYLVTVGVVAGAVIVLILLVGNGAAASVVAAIVAGLAAVGVTGRSVSAALSKAAGGVEKSLVQAELDAAMGAAATVELGGRPATPRRAVGS